MTCIAGIVEEGKIYMGADSAGVDISTYKMTYRADEKIFIRNKKMLYGFTSSFRMGQLLRYSLKIPPHPDTMDDMTYLTTRFIDAVRKCLKTGGYQTKKDEVETGGCFLLGYKSNLYTIFDDYQVAKSLDPISAIGCGADFALGSLHTSTGNPLARLKMALEAASHWSVGVSPPFNYLLPKGI